MDPLYGCTKCRYLKTGCGACREVPVMERPSSVRWLPGAGRYQTEVPSAPTFYPTPEQFQDPVAYIESIRAEGEKCAPGPCPSRRSWGQAGDCSCIHPGAPLPQG